MRQEYPINFLNTIAQAYDIGTIQGHKLFTSWYDNSNYYIQTSKGEFVIKIFEWEGINQEIISFETQVMNTINKAGVLSPSVYPNGNNELCTIIDEKYIILMEYRKGENMDRKILGDNIAFECGEEMAKMQNALQEFKDNTRTRQGYEFDQKNILQLEANIDMIHPSFNKEIFHSILQEYRDQKEIFDHLPHWLIHNDVAARNILVQDNHLTSILDFSDMVFSPYVQDISIFIGESIFWYNYQPHQVEIFLKGYNKHRKLNNEELSLLPLCIKQRMTCLILAFSRRERDYGSDPQRKRLIEEMYKYLVRFINNHEKSFVESLI